MVAILTGDLSSGILGPLNNRSQNDVALLNDYLLAAGGTSQPRGLFIQGDGFGQSEIQSGGIDPAHTAFLRDKLGVVYRSPTYVGLSGNTSDCADLITTSGLTANADVYGVANLCTWSNEVFDRNPALTETEAGAYYEAVGPNAPYVAEVVKPAAALRPWVAVTSPYDIEHLFSRYCDTPVGRQVYYCNVLNTVFGSLCQMTGSCDQILDVPQGGRGREFVNFMRLGNSVQQNAPTQVHLGLEHADRVEVSLYDVLGRRVRILANREFQAGPATLQWDGRGDNGQLVARGVYFVRVRYARNGFESSGRVIVLR